jgi:DNA (cytosine-5)-methyltransferase 1
MGIGLQAAGMEHLLSFELAEAPHSVLLKAGKEALQMDLADVGNACLAMRERPDLIAGGPPCQDFSKAGRREPGDRALLTVHFAQIVCLQRVEWFVFENVPEVTKSSEYRRARALWKRHGYGLTELVLDAQEYGVPQRRKRFICIGRLNEIDGFLADEVKSAARKPMVMRDILDPRRFPDDAALLRAGCFFAHPLFVSAQKPTARGVFGLDDPCPTVTRNTGRDPKHLYTPHPDDVGTFEEAHRLTSEQLARIQGFPASYDFERKKYRYARPGWPEPTVNVMIVNAVPAPMAQAIGKCIIDRHYGRSIPKLDKGFSDYLRDRRPDLTDAAVYNVRSAVNRARRMLEGRVYANPALEMQALDGSYENGNLFSSLPTKTQSDLRQALMLYRGYIETTRESSPWAPKPPKMPDFRSPPSKPKMKKLKHVFMVDKWAEYRPRLKFSSLSLNGLGEAYDHPRDEYVPEDKLPHPRSREDDWRPDGYDEPDCEV